MISTDKIVHSGHVVITDGVQDVHFLIRDKRLKIRWYTNAVLEDSFYHGGQNYLKDILYDRTNGRKVYRSLMKSGSWKLVLCEENPHIHP